MRRYIAGLAAFVVACGGGESAEMENAEEAAVAPAAAAPAVEGTGTVHEVDMELTEDGQYVFSPAELTIRVGDTVRWINVSGGPHNVAFWADSMPAGAAETIDALMPNKMGSLMGEMLAAPNAGYEVVFADAPVGDYRYYCMPHLALNMVATLTIEE